MEVEVYVNNRTAVLYSTWPQKQLMPYWSFAHPKYQFVRRARPGWDGMIKLCKNGSMPAGLFWATKKEIEQKEGIQFKVQARLENLDRVNGLTSKGNWVFQNDVVEAALRVVRFGGGTIVNATGSGKTRIAAMLASRLNVNVCFVVDQLVLLNQAKSDMESELKEPIGVIGESVFKPERVTVATRQSLFLYKQENRFKKWASSLDVMFIDEIHEQMNHSNFKVVEAILPKTVFGLTATLQMRKKPVRLKVWALSGPVIFEYPIGQGQTDKVLSDGIVVRLKYENTVSTREQRRGWAAAYKEKIVFNNERNQMIADVIKEAANRGYYIVVLVTRVRHLKELSMRLGTLPHRIVSGTYQGVAVDIEDRMASKDDFEAGKVKVILANAVFKKGVNIKRLDFIIDAAAGRSEDDAIQKFGRGLRKHWDKDGLIHIDVSDADDFNKDNWFSVAAKERMKTFNRAGITAYKFWWEYEGEALELIKSAEVWLRSEIDGKANSLR